MLHGKYTGSCEDHLVGERALLMRNPDGSLLAQFDNLSLPLSLTHNWVCFPARDFEIEIEHVNVFKNDSTYSPHDENCNCITCIPDSHSRFQ
jgi:hypothetical protein